MCCMTVAEYYILEEMIVLIFINFIYACSITPTNVVSSNPSQARCTRYTNDTYHDANTGSNQRERPWVGGQCACACACVCVYVCVCVC